MEICGFRWQKQGCCTGLWGLRDTIDQDQLKNQKYLIRFGVGGVGNHFRGNRSANVDRLSLQIPAPDRVKVVAQMGCMVNTNFESDTSRFQTGFFCKRTSFTEHLYTRTTFKSTCDAIGNEAGVAETKFCVHYGHKYKTNVPKRQ